MEGFVTLTIRKKDSEKLGKIAEILKLKKKSTAIMYLLNLLTVSLENAELYTNLNKIAKISLEYAKRATTDSTTTIMMKVKDKKKVEEFVEKYEICFFDAISALVKFYDLLVEKYKDLTDEEKELVKTILFGGLEPTEEFVKQTQK